MTKQEYLTCPICAAQTKDYFVSTSGSLITDVKCTNRKCFFSSNYVPINVWDRYMHMVERCYSLEAENAKLRAEIAQLKADNLSLVEQMNQTALKPNQEIIEWHERSEELPTDSGHYLILCEDDDVYIGWFNNGSDEAGNPEDHCPWGAPEWLIEVQDPGAYKVIAWAYLPKGVINEHKTN